MNTMFNGSNGAGVRLVVASALVAALALSACSATDDTAVTAAPAEQSADTGQLATVSGSQIDVNSLEGTDTILWFWAPW